MTRHVYDDSVNKPYRKLKVDQIPVIEVPEQWSYQDLLEKYFLEHGKPLKLVKWHKNSQEGVGSSGARSANVALTLRTTMTKQRSSKHENVCSHWKRSRSARATTSTNVKTMKAITPSEKKRFQEEPHAFKVRYIFRQFHFDFKPLAVSSPV